MEAININAINDIKLRDPAQWAAWKFRVKVLLRAAGVLGIVDGSSPRPVEAKEEFAAWADNDAKAQNIIVGRLAEKTISQVLSCTTAKQIWDRLHTVFEQKGNLSIHIAQEKFYNLRFNENDTVANFLGRFEETLATLESLGVKITTSMVITKITSSLPTSYKHFVSAWESVPAEKQTYEELSSRLLVEELRMKDGASSTSEAFKAVKKGRKCFKCGLEGHYKFECGKGQFTSKKNKFCNFCKKSNHSTSECWFKHKSKNSRLPSYNDKDKSSNAFHVSMLPALNAQTCQGRNTWIMDSGASEHMCHNIKCFTDYESFPLPKQIIIGDGTVIHAKGVGIIHLQAYNGTEWTETSLNGALYVPDMKLNLFSVSSATDKGYVLEMNKEKCIFRKNNKQQICAIAHRKDRLYIMKFRYKENEIACVGKVSDNLLEWHSKMGHQDIEQVKNVLKRSKISVSPNSGKSTCEDCLKGKLHKQPFPLSEVRGQQPGEILHMDLCGPMEVSSLGGAYYYLLIKDDYSRFRTVYFLSNKSDTVKHINKFLMYITNNLGHKVKIIRSDNGKEFINQQMQFIMDKMGIIHQTSCAYTPEQNGCAEREVRTVTEAARTMLLSSSLNKNLWAEAVNTAVYVLNRTSKSRVKDVTPYELWFNKGIFDIKQLKVFGSKVSVHVPQQKRLKWDSKSEIGYFVGYGENTKGYRVYFPDKNEVLIKREVIFIQQKEYYNTSKEHIPEETEWPVEYLEEEHETRQDNEYHSFYEEDTMSMHDLMIEEQENQEEIIQKETECLPSDKKYLDEPGCLQSSHEIEESVQKEQEINRPSRRKVTPQWLDQYETGFVTYNEPLTYEEAMTKDDKDKWKEAINREMDTLNANNTFTVVSKIPKGTNIISTKWVFKIKDTDEGKLYKARLVARGFEQRDGISDVYSPVAKLGTFRLFMALANKLKQSVYQMDVVSAFLHGDIKEIVYIKLHTGEICKLNKSLYGLKKAPKYWNEKFDNFITKLGFTRSKNDSCLYFKREEGKYMYVLLYVDDILYFGSDQQEIQCFKVRLSQNFKMKDLGLVSTYLGIKIKQKDGITTLNQEKYLISILKNYQMLNCNPVSTPIDQNFNFQILQRERSESSEIETKCRQLIGSLLYAACGTRPDICVAVSFLSRFQHCASQMLYKCLKRILRYIKGTLQLSLVYNCSSALVEGYVDADWAGDMHDRKSTSGYIFKLFGCTILWYSKKQICVSLSSTESEYIALSLCIVEANWLKNLLTEFNIKCNNITIYEDNQSVIKLAYNSENIKRLKHIDIRYKYIVEQVNKGLISLKYINTSENIADIFTKPLGKTMFEKLRNELLK